MQVKEREKLLSLQQQQLLLLLLSRRGGPPPAGVTAWGPPGAPLLFSDIF